MANYIEFAGEEPESLLPDPKDSSAPIDMMLAEDLLTNSVNEDVKNFMAFWQQGVASGDASYPAELPEDEWYREFYAWMGV
jgi:hypothetical protein